MFDLLSHAVNRPYFVELRFHDRLTRSVSVDTGVLESVRSIRHSGVGVRVLVNGSYGFASTSVASKEAIDRAIDEAVRAALALATQADKRDPQRRRPQLAVTQWQSGLFQEPAKDSVVDHALAEKIDLAVRMDAWVRRHGQRIQASSAAYTEMIDEKYIVTSDGARVHIRDVKPEFRVGAVAALDGQLETWLEAAGHTGGFGDLFARRTPEEMAEKAVRTATDLLRAPHVEGGRKQVILAPDVVGLLVHEAIGHTVEADFVLAGSAAAGKIGQQVASDLVTLCDSGKSEYSSGAGGVVLVDDEGTPAQKVTIIEKGILRSYLHNRETAALFGVEPTGNARAFEYDNEPLIRMRNTYIEPGNSKLDDIIADTEDGFLVVGAKNGQADANAEFMFAAGEMYPIKKGKLGTLHRGTTITGNAFTVLQSVDRVADDFTWDLGSGFCGKGQPAKVDAGGPHLRCTVTLAGG